MKDLLANPFTWAAGAIFLLRRTVRLLRELLELRNEWYRRES